MKTIQSGNTFRIYDSSMRVFDVLPVGSYTVRFDKQTGFFLEIASIADIKDGKIYGVHDAKCNKVLSSFAVFKRNLGVILSGDKGIGKSLFAKLLAAKAFEIGLPTIIVDEYIPGISSYIESIEQECLVMFDEFDKTYGEVKAKEGSASPQTELLSLFDGFAHGKKLFVVTCNELGRLNSFLINRPGRFHYHFRFEYPTADEIREYLQDNVPEQYHHEIEKVVMFSNAVKLNYDCLRAIAFELSTGLSFDEAIADLNIVNIERETYSITLKFNNGLTAFDKEVALNIFTDDEREDRWLGNKQGDYFVKVSFTPTDVIWDNKHMAYTIPVDKFELHYSRDSDYTDIVEAAKQAGPECLIIRRHLENGIHYKMAK